MAKLISGPKDGHFVGIGSGNPESAQVPYFTGETFSPADGSGPCKSRRLANYRRTDRLSVEGVAEYEYTHDIGSLDSQMPLDLAIFYVVD